MSNSDKLEDYKKEIRSILIPYQKGCFFSEFNRAYRDLIGQRLPFREMGFRTDIEFLYSMPDVVKITPTRTGEYHLLGIADEKSKHIQKMVARQKPAKLKPPRPPPLRLTYYSKPAPRSYVPPPRFTELKKPVEPIVPQTTYPKEPKMPTKAVQNELKLPPKASPREEVICLIQHFNNKLAIDDVLCEYQRMYNKSLSLSKYGFTSIEKCINVIPQLEIVQINNVSFVRYIQTDEGKNVENSSEVLDKSKQSYDESPLRTPSPEVPSKLNSVYSSQNGENGNIPNSLREKLQKVAERFSQGIWASDFPNYFEEVTGQFFELADLGYRCLSDLIDDVPDIFNRRPVAGSKKDYIIYPANSDILEGKAINPSSDVPKSLSGFTLVDHVISNLRKILLAIPEGIQISQLSHMYSINCKDSLHIEDFGFDNLETFLSSIKNRVPLQFHTIKGEKSIHLLKLADNLSNSFHASAEAYDQEAIPFDALFPEFKYKFKKFPPDFDFKKFIPAYMSSVAHAGHLYIQLQEEGTDQSSFVNLGAELDKFYNGHMSEQYMMKTIHIKVGASCIAKWPVDQHWYRAEIISISSLDNIQVHYVDYGTRDTIPMVLLRYARKEFIDLPIQAIRCRLAFLKPPNKASKWDVQTRNRILQMCEDVLLMARIEEIGSDGIYSIILCDTNGEEDVFINDELRKEGLADHTLDNSPSPEPIMTYNLNPIQALQAQYYLQAFATVAPSFSQNDHYIQLLRQVSVCCQNSESMQQNISAPFAQSSGPPGFNSVPSSLTNSFVNPMTLYNTYPSAVTNVEASLSKKPKASNTIPPPVSTADFFAPPPVSTADFFAPSPVSTADFFAPSPEYESSTSPVILPEGNTDGDNDLFDDDDDEMFQEFCQKVTSSTIQYVRRVILGDGYKIHIIVVKSKPYASSGDISQLIWNNKEADYLIRRLQMKDVDIPAVSVSEDGNEDLFLQLLQFNVKGVQKTTGFKSSIVLYPLVTVIKILNLFGHPSVSLRTRLTEEIANFNPSDPKWIESSPDSVESDDEGILPSITDDDKIERLCLHDLLDMKESILFKRKMLSTNDLNKNNIGDELEKLNKLYDTVLKRIQEIKEICEFFK